MSRYSVETWVAPGVQVDDYEAPTLAEVIARAQDARVRWPNRHATSVFCNIGRCDVDTNGLTEDEWETLEEGGV